MIVSLFLEKIQFLSHNKFACYTYFQCWFITAAGVRWGERETERFGGTIPSIGLWLMLSSLFSIDPQKGKLSPYSQDVW